MMRRLLSSLIPHPSSLFFAIALVASSAQALDVPPPPNTYVTDKAAVLSETDAHALNEKLASFEQRSGAQFIIYTFPTLDAEALEDFTIRCAELCGLWHGHMFQTGQVVSAPQFASWIALQRHAEAANLKYLPPYARDYFPDPTRRAG